MKHTLLDHFWTIVTLPIYFVSILCFFIWLNISVTWKMGQKDALKLAKQGRGLQ